MKLSKNLASVLAVAALTALAGEAIAAETKLATFGLITDTHVCDKADQSESIAVTASPRYFTGGPAKIEAFAADMNARKADFVAELGDFSDNPADSSLSAAKKREMALAFLSLAESKLGQFRGARYHVFGNHDTDQLSKKDVFSILRNEGIGADRTWYSFDRAGVHVVVLDGSYTDAGVSYDASNYSWDNSVVPKAELDWLAQDLESARSPVIVLTHQLLNPLELVEKGFDVNHEMRNAPAVRQLLEKSGKVAAVFSGHYHDGGFQTVNGIPYVVLQANAAYGNDVSYHNQYAVVDVFADGKKVKTVVSGHGMQRSYVAEAVLK